MTDWWPFGGEGSASIYRVRPIEGDAIVAGRFEKTLLLGNPPLEAAATDGFDGFVARLDAAGNPKWATRITGQGSAAVRGLAVDAKATAIYVTGDFTADASFGPCQLLSSGGSDVFVARLSPAGSVEWCTAFGSDEAEIPYAIAVQGERVAVAASYGSTTFKIGDTTIPGALGGQDALVALLDDKGNSTKAWGFGSQFPFEAAFGVAFTPGVLVAAVNFGGATTVEGDVKLNYTIGNGVDLGLVDFNLSDPPYATLTRSFGGKGDEYGLAFDMASDGSRVMGGYFTGTWNVLGNAMVAVGHADAFVVRTNSNGQLKWGRRFGAADGNIVQLEWDAVWDVMATPADVLLSGVCWAGCDLPVAPAACTDGDAVVARLDGEDGKTIWATVLSGPGFDAAWSVDWAEGKEPVLAAGEMSQSLTIAGHSVQANADGKADALLLHLMP